MTLLHIQKEIQKKILIFIRPHSNNVFNVSHQKDFFTCFRVVGLSNLRAHKFKQLFSHTYLICICGFDIKTLNHFFLHCPSFTNERQNLLLKVERIIPNIYRKSDTIITSIRLSGDQSFSSELNSDILNSSIDYILSTQKFESALFTKT